MQHRNATPSVRLPPKQMRSAWPNQPFLASHHSHGTAGDMSLKSGRTIALTITMIALIEHYLSYRTTGWSTNGLNSIKLGPEAAASGRTTSDNLEFSELSTTGSGTTLCLRETPHSIDQSRHSLRHNGSWLHGMGHSWSRCWRVTKI